MDRIRRSWELFKSSLAVMMQNKTLLAFPILIAALTVFMVMLFLTPVAFQPTGYSYASAQHWQAVSSSIYYIKTTDKGGAVSPAATDESRSSRPSNASTRNGGFKPLGIVYFAIMYFATMFLATFLNVAFYREIMNALRGQPVSIVSGLRFAATKWKIILMWTLFAGVVGFIIKTLEERFGLIGQWIMRLIGAVWSVACVFVIPVIITEENTANPFIVLKKSAQTLTKTWGESLIGYAGVSLGSSIILVLSLFWLGAGIALAVLLHSNWLGAAAVLSWLIAIVIFSYLMSVASQIFRCALFLYASQGALPHPYTEEMMSLAWKTKRK